MRFEIPLWIFTIELCCNLKHQLLYSFLYVMCFILLFYINLEYDFFLYPRTSCRTYSSPITCMSLKSKSNSIINNSLTSYVLTLSNCRYKSEDFRRFFFLIIFASFSCFCCFCSTLKLLVMNYVVFVGGFGYYGSINCVADVCVCCVYVWLCS